MRFEPSASNVVMTVSPRDGVVSNENELHDRLASALPGTTIVYHVGLLARDRDRLASTLPQEQRVELNALASRAWRLAEAGWLYLLQQRVAPDCCAYIAVVRPRPRNVPLLPITRRRRSQHEQTMATLLGGAAA
jgi:hypothetical protein